MSNRISRAESWSTVYKAFQNINFSAYDFTTVKSSLRDYIQQYHSENFNDFIENSEIIAQIESFAYIAEILAYRQDMNAHENFFALAERKDSILQLAKFISYNASRNLPPRGLVKITSIQTTQDTSDTKGNSLANKKIIWNDSNNQDWKEQFFQIMNLVMEQQYGSVSPNDRVQVDDVLFELYRLKNRSLVNGVFSYSAASNGETYPMELVPSALNANGPYERRPDISSPFSVVYGSDGLGDSSDTTGFFCYTKQGKLNKIRKNYDGITPNQTTRLNVQGINDTDLWINNVDADTGRTFAVQIVDNLGRRLGASGEWVQVDIANIENVIFNTNLNRNKFEVETLDGDDVRVIFGDGEFADIPSGAFDIWYRTSTAGSGVILQNSVINKSASFTYQDDQQKVQTITFTFSLVSSLVNGSAAEDIERIRRFAPSVFYTQDRMVNGRDYNQYPLQDQSIAKMRAVNRTFSGDSKYLAWHDPSEYYEDVKIFGDDLSLYYHPYTDSKVVVGSQPLGVIRSALQPLLTTIGIYVFHAVSNKALPLREFTSQEVGTASTSKTLLGEMSKGLTATGSKFTLYVVYRPEYSESSLVPLRYNWVTFNSEDVAAEPSIAAESTFTLTYSRPESKWVIGYNAVEITAASPSTAFFFNNGQKKILVSDTLNAALDNLVVLGANISATGGLIGENRYLNVIGDVTETALPITGQQDTSVISVVTSDANQDGTPDDLTMDGIAISSQTSIIATSGAFPRQHDVTLVATDVMANRDELRVYVNGKKFTRAVVKEDGTLEIAERYVDGDNTEVTVGQSDALYTYVELLNGKPVTETDTKVTGIRLMLNDVAQPPTSIAASEYSAFIRRWSSLSVKIDHLQFAYFRANDAGTWDAVPYSGIAAARLDWSGPSRNVTLRRFIGRTALNFAWFHRTPRYHLVDPSATNIIDMFVVTRAYYEELRRWLRNEVTDKPVAPSALDLRGAYDNVLDSRMISDTVVLHPGKFKFLFGPKAPSQLRCEFKVVKAPSGQMTDNELKVQIVNVIRKFFDIDQWEFGETFYATELSSMIHANLPGELDSIVLVPTSTNSQFGDLYEVIPDEDELFLPSVSVNDIVIVDHYNSRILNQG